MPVISAERWGDFPSDISKRSQSATCDLVWQAIFSKDGWNNLSHSTCSSYQEQSLSFHILLPWYWQPFHQKSRSMSSTPESGQTFFFSVNQENVAEMMLWDFHSSVTKYNLVSVFLAEILAPEAFDHDVRNWSPWSFHIVRQPKVTHEKDHMKRPWHYTERCWSRTQLLQTMISLQLHEKPWARPNHMGLSQIPDPQNLWEIIKTGLVLSHY